jgi:uncharacterized protein YbjT (DUF2867 family)
VVDIVRADLDEPNTLAPTLIGADRLYLFPRPATVTRVAELAWQAGIRRIVTLSSAPADQEPKEAMYHLSVERLSSRSMCNGHTCVPECSPGTCWTRPT